MEQSVPADALVHRKSCGLTGEEGLHASENLGSEAAAEGSPLLRLWTPLSQANSHMDQSHEVAAKRGHRDRTLRTKMPGRRMELRRKVEAYTWHSEGEQQGDTGQRQSSMEEYGATETAQRALARSGGLNDESERQEKSTTTIEGRDGGFRPD